MEPFYHLGEMTAAGILSAAAMDHPTIWAWFLVATVAAIGIRLREQSRRGLQAIPVRSRPNRITRRTALRSPRF